MKEVYAYRHGENLYINLTNACCNDCAFCIRRGGDGVGEYDLRLSREPSAEEVVEAVKAFPPETYNDIVFCGYGEPTVKLSVMLGACDYFHSIGKRTRLNTNGLGNLIHKKDITGELVGKIDAVSVSLNDDNAKDYQAVCKSSFGEKAYDAMIEFTRLCVSRGIKAYMTVVDVISKEKIENCRRIATSVGAVLRVREYVRDNKNY